MHHLEQDWRECRWDCQSGRTCQVDQVHSNQVWPEVSNWVARNHSVELRNKYDSWCPGMWMMMSSANGPVTSLMGKTLSVGRSTGLAKLNLFVIHLFSSQAKCLWVPWWRRCWGGRTWILLQADGSTWPKALVYGRSWPQWRARHPGT